MVGGGTPRACGAQHQVELFADLLLADELAQVLGAQGGLDGLVLPVGDRVHQALRCGSGGGVGRVGRVVPVHVCLTEVGSAGGPYPGAVLRAVLPMFGVLVLSVFLRAVLSAFGRCLSGPCSVSGGRP